MKKKKKYICFLLTALCLLTCAVLPASAVTLTPMQQMALLAGYNSVIADHDDLYARYCYYDFNRDGLAELILLTGDSAATEGYTVYGWRNGDFSYWGSFDGGHSGLYAPPGENRLLLQYGHMGYEIIYEISVKNGAVTEKKISDKTVTKVEDYTQLEGALEMYPCAFCIFPDEDRLTALQSRYIDKMMEYEANEVYYLPDMTGGGYPDIIACSAAPYDASEYTLYENKSGRFVEEGSIIDSFMDFAYPKSGRGILALDQGEGVWRLTISNGRFVREREYGDWDRLIVTDTAVPQIITVFCPLYPRPDAPDGVRAQAVSASSVRLAWNGTGEADHFEVYRSDSENGVYRLCKEVRGNCNCTVSGLQPGTTYYFRVKAVENSVGNLDAYNRPYFDFTLSSAFSDTVSAKTSGQAATKYQLGDVTNDGQITAEDARLALRAAVGLESYAKSSREFLAADATKDGMITAEDARLILRAAVGLETLA